MAAAQQVSETAHRSTNLYHYSQVENPLKTQQHFQGFGSGQGQPRRANASMNEPFARAAPDEDDLARAKRAAKSVGDGLD